MSGAMALLKVTKHDTCRFQRFMFSFSGLKDGFKKDSTPFIGFNGCHLKGPFKGLLLSAVSLHANKGIFPIAICICESENTQSWTWFLGDLQDYLADDKK